MGFIFRGIGYALTALAMLLSAASAATAAVKPDGPTEDVYVQLMFVFGGIAIALMLVNMFISDKFGDRFDMTAEDYDKFRKIKSEHALQTRVANLSGRNTGYGDY